MKKAFIGIGMFLILLGGLLYVDNTLLKDLGAEDLPISSEQDQTVNQQENQREIGIRRGNVAANFTLVNLDGKEESLWDYRGKKVILNFWFSDCPPCREEMPDLNEFYNANKDRDIVVLGVNQGESHQKVKNFIEEGGYNFPILLDERSNVGYSYGLRYFPTTYFINEDGVIEDIHIGLLTLENLNSRYK